MEFLQVNIDCVIIAAIKTLLSRFTDNLSTLEITFATFQKYY